MFHFSKCAKLPSKRMRLWAVIFLFPDASAAVIPPPTTSTPTTTSSIPPIVLVTVCVFLRYRCKKLVCFRADLFKLGDCGSGLNIKLIQLAWQANYNLREAV